MHFLAKIAFLTGLITISPISPASAASNLLVILDASGSMWGQVDGVVKMKTAKEAIGNLLGDLPADTKVGLMAYGHRVKDDCQDVETISGIGSETRGAIAAKAIAITPLGKTPIAYSLETSAASFNGLETANNNLVLISDGIESCDGDPCAVAKSLASKGIGVKVHVVGFNVDVQTRAQLECIAKNGNGKFFDAKDTTAFKQAIAEVQQIAQATPAPEPEPTVVEYFRDDFDGEDLGEHWEVINPNPDNYIVEDGFLNVLSSVELNLYDQSDKLPNLFKLTKPLPKGNWTATLRLNPAITTMRETYSLALYTDKDKFLLASANVAVATHAGHLSVNLFGRKAAGGQNTDFTKGIYFSKEALGHSNVTRNITAYTELAAKDVQAIMLRIHKSGRSYFISGKFEGDAATAGGQEPQWVELQKLTSLRSPGKFLAISIGQAKFSHRDAHLKGGETLVSIDWVKIETEK